jgi:site-specific DNA-methyltransferase (adenine-specific)
MSFDNITLMQGDCLERMKEIDSGSVDMILADPPYGTTACKWDSIIDLNLMWKQLNRIIKPNGAIVMTASQPFTSKLISSNYKMFKYCWVWEKSRFTGFLQAKYMPMKAHEDICVFVQKSKPTYNPQKTTGHTPTNSAKGEGHSPTFGASKERDYKGGDTTRYPKTVQNFKSERGNHPTQKPVALMEYLIKTYTNEGEKVLDFCMGSGTTGVAAKNLNRKFIGIELDEEYFEIAKSRIKLN